jgi:hypothetical protein
MLKNDITLFHNGFVMSKLLRTQNSGILHDSLKYKRINGRSNQGLFNFRNFKFQIEKIYILDKYNCELSNRCFSKFPNA